VDELDQEIKAAYRRLTVQRATFMLSASGEVFTACEQAERELNDLLDRRYELLMVGPIAVAA
jgi:hypothetical protein